MSVNARSCVLTSPIAPRFTSARTIPSAPIRRSFEFVPCSSSSNRNSIGGSPARQIENLAQPRDLGVETGAAFLQGIVDANAGPHLQRGKLTGGGLAPARPPWPAQRLFPTARSKVLFPDMLEPLTSRTRVFPHMLTLLRTQVAAGTSGCPSSSASNAGRAHR